jgi:hypothetical protein
MKGLNPSVRLDFPVQEIEITDSQQLRSTLRLQHFCYATLLVVLVIFAIVRIRLRNMPLERDEGEYAYAGQLILQGVPPYSLAYNMKLPGTYVAYAVMMAAFGQTVAGIRIGMLVVLLGNTLLVFFLGRRLFGILAGTVAAASYTILANRLTTVSLNGHATHFIALMALAGTLLLLYAIEKQRIIALFGSGIFFGLAFLMKQHGLLLTFFGFIFWAWSAWKRRTSRRNLITEGSALAAGMVLPFLLTCLIMWYGGVFRNFWFWTVSYGSAYEKEVKFAEGWNRFRAMLIRFARPLNIWIPAGLGLTALFWDRRGREHKVLVLGFALFSFLAVFPGFWFRPHYFLVIYPAVALLAGLGISASYEYLRERKLAQAIVWIPIVLFVLSYASALRGQRKYLFKMSPERVHREMYIGDGFPEAAAVGNYIRDHSSTQDRVAIIGSEPEIYFLSRRHSATGYIYMYPLMEKQPFALRMQGDMIHQIEETQPKILVFVDTLSGAWDIGWNASEPHMNLFLWTRSYLGARYDLMAEVPIQGSVDNLWGLPCRYYIFQRK